MSPSVKASRRRWLWLAPLLLLAVPLWLVTLLALFLETGLGKRTAASLIEDALSQPGQQVSIGRLEGSFFGRLSIERVAFSDDKGVWLELDEAVLDWTPKALFDGTLRIERLAAQRLALQRLPPPTQEQPPSEGPLLPRLPFEVVAKEIAIERIELGEPLLGETATLTLNGTLAIERNRAVLDAAVTRLDAVGGFLAADLVWDPATDALQLKLQAQEPAGGVAARLAGLPGLPAVDLDLDGTGTLSAWKGRLRLALGGEEALTASLELAGEPVASLRLDGRLSRDGVALAERLSGVAGLAAWAPAGLDIDIAASRAGETLAVSELRLGSSVFSLQGSGTLAGEAVQATAKASLADGRPLAALLPDLTLGAATFELTLGGTLSQPQGSLTLDATSLAYGPAAFDRVEATLHAEPQAAGDIALSLDLSGTDPVLSGPAPDWIWGDLRLSAAALLDEAGALTVERLKLDARALKAAWEGRFAVDMLAADGRLAFDGRLPELAQMPGAVLDLEFDASLQSDDLTEAGSATLAGHLQGSGTLPPEAAELLRSGVDFAGRVELAGDGTLTLSAASMQGQGLAVDLDGTLKDAAVDFAFRIEAENLAAIAAPLGAEAAGSLHLEGRLEGDAEAGYSATADLGAKNLSVSGQQIGALDGRLDLSGFPQQPEGTLLLTAPATPYGPLAVAATVKPQAGGGFHLEPLSLELGTTLQLAGRLEAPEAMLPLTGKLSGQLQGSALLTELTGLDVKGRGAVELDLSAAGGQQAATLSLRLQPGEFAGVAHRGLTLQGKAQDLLGTPRLDAAFAASGVALGSTSLDSLRGTARGPLQNLEVTLAAAGSSDGQPLKLDAAAQLDATAAAPTIRLQRLQGSAMAQDFRLLRPTTLHLGDTLRLESTALEVAGTSLTIELTDRAGERQLRASFEALQAKTLAPFLTGYDASGTLSGTLTLTDRGSGATGTLEINGREILVQQQGLAVAPAVNLVGTAKLGGGSLATSLQLSGSFGENLLVDVTFPFRVSLYSFDVAVPGDGRLAGRVSWRGELAQLADFLPLDNQVLAGDLTLDLTLSGTLGSPRVAGEVALVNGRYENLVYGTLVESLNLRMTGEGRQLVVQEASASDGRGGTLTMSGSIDVAEMAMDLTLRLKDFAVVQREDLFVAFDARLKIEPRGDLQVLAGTLTGREARLDVAARLPHQVTTLDVVVLKDGEPLGPARERAGDWREEAAPLPFALGLDLVVDLPQRIFVHGSGLESEWGGRLEISGTTEQPIIRGQLTPKRGQFDALGRAFVLQDSAITFDGGPTVDPILSIEATADSGDITAIVQVTGRASDPQIHFTSNPLLPEDEVISRVLFGRGTGKLSALEAVQLAEALAIFTGATKSKVGIVDRLRAGLGLDVLRFEAGATDEQIGSVTAGEYVAKDVFVGVSQGTTPGSTAATVEYEVTDDIVIEGRAGQQSSVGIRWQWDY